VFFGFVYRIDNFVCLFVCLIVFLFIMYANCVI
jgi:hypothetical protein